MSNVEYVTTKMDLLIDAVADRLIREASRSDVPAESVARAFRDFCMGLAELDRVPVVGDGTDERPSSE